MSELRELCGEAHLNRVRGLCHSRRFIWDQVCFLDCFSSVTLTSLRARALWGTVAEWVQLALDHYAHHARVIRARKF